jgi:hypothetical protein
MLAAWGTLLGVLAVGHGQEMAPEIKSWDVVYTGDAVPTGCAFTGAGDFTAEADNGVLHLADRGTGPGEAASYLYLWKANPARATTVEARVKVGFCRGGSAGVYLEVTNGRFEEYLTLYEDRIALQFAGLEHRMDTRADFHTYRLTIKESDINVYVDGQLRIDGTGKLTHAAYGGRNSVTFGSGTSAGTGEAYWDWLRFCVEKPTGVNPEKGAVTVERTQILFESAEDVNFPCAVRFADGTIWVGVSNGEHTVSERAAKVVSTDNGGTWQTADFPVWPMGMCVLPEGRIVRVGAWGEKPLRRSVYPLTVERLPDQHGTAVERSTCEVELPWAVDGLYLHRSLVRTADGGLLASAYSRVQVEPRCRSYCIRSADDGKTWEFLSTMAYDPTIGSEGYDEPVLERLANGDLLCLMRTGDHGGAAIQPGHHFPLMQTRSHDHGKTWETPHEVASHGVDPDLRRLSSGILVATFGRPHVLLMVDFEGSGDEWDGVIPIYRGFGCSYTSILEIEPTLLMVIYTESSMHGIDGAGPLNRLMAAYIRLQKR